MPSLRCCSAVRPTVVQILSCCVEKEGSMPWLRSREQKANHCFRPSPPLTYWPCRKHASLPNARTLIRPIVRRWLKWRTNSVSDQKVRSSSRDLYDHINFIHHPKPLVVGVVEVAPPEPPKLYGLARQVLSYADLPPIRLELERIEVRELAESVHPSAYLVPCRSGGLDDDRLRAQLAIPPPLLW